MKIRLSIATFILVATTQIVVADEQQISLECGKVSLIEQEKGFYSANKNCHIGQLNPYPWGLDFHVGVQHVKAEEADKALNDELAKALNHIKKILGTLEYHE